MVMNNLSRRPHDASGMRVLVSVLLGALLVALLLAGAPAAARAQDAPTAVPPTEAKTEAPLRVVIKPLSPFVIRDGGAYRGFSIDLWEEIARRTGHAFEYVWVETVPEQLDAVADATADVGITGISITRDRELRMDFSLPHFRAGLQMMTAAGVWQGWATSLGTLAALLFSRDVLLLLGGLFILILIAAHLFWLLERKTNTGFPQAYLAGVWEGIWYAVVTLVTVGYGDRAAITKAGRVVAMIWMFLSLLLVANFTANLTSQLTLTKFQSLINGVDDLPGKRVATVEGSTSAEWLQSKRLPYTGTETIEEAYELLYSDKAEVILFDSPVLLFYASGEGRGRVQLVGEIFELQDYGIAVPTGSELREPINRALLGIAEDGTYDEIYNRWFGSR
jgi:ABC-type amino acid transport substrate-binding protein